jgi:hypothetical protein
LIRKYLYLALFGVTAIVGSFFIHNSIDKPSSTVLTANDFKQANIQACVSDVVNGRYSIRVSGGEVGIGSIGLLTSKLINLNQGDCFGGRVQLASADPILSLIHI